jgi:hypothetical protein
MTKRVYNLRMRRLMCDAETAGQRYELVKEMKDGEGRKNLRLTVITMDFITMNRLTVPVESSMWSKSQ